MFTIDDFFLIFKLIQNNRDFSSYSLYNLDYPEDVQNMDENMVINAGNAKLQSEKYFNEVIDQFAFSGYDYDRLRNLFIDWYSSLRTLNDLSSNSIHPYSLPESMVNEALKSFGFPYPESMFSTKHNKAQFLLSLVHLYKIKGTPKAIVRALKYAGITDVKIFEWWLSRKWTDNGRELIFIGKKVTESENLKFNLIADRREFSYREFELIKDPYWKLDSASILDSDAKLFNNQAPTLPSITPYITVATQTEHPQVQKTSMILNAISNTQFQRFLYGELTENLRNIRLSRYSMDITILEFLCAIYMIYHRWNDLIKFNALRKYIIGEYDIDPLQDPQDLIDVNYNPFTFQQPFSYERLLFWAYNSTITKQNRDIVIDLSGFTRWPISIGFMDYIMGSNENSNINFMGQISDNKLDYDYGNSGSNYPVHIYDSQPGFPELVPGETDHELRIFRYNDLNSGALIDTEPSVGDEDLIKVLNTEFDKIFNRESYQIRRDASWDTYPFNATEDSEEKVNYRYLVNKKKFHDEYTAPFHSNYLRNRWDCERLLNGNLPITRDQWEDGKYNPDESFLVMGNRDAAGEVLEKPAFYDPDTTQLNTDIVNQRQLGLNPTLYNYIDSELQLANEDQYQEILQDLLNQLDYYIYNNISSETIMDISRALLGDLSGNRFGSLVNFFKPKRARILAYESILAIGNPLYDYCFPTEEFTSDNEIDIPEYAGQVIPERLRSHLYITPNSDSDSISDLVNVDNNVVFPLDFSDLLYLSDTYPSASGANDSTFEFEVGDIFDELDSTSEEFYVKATTGTDSTSLNATDIYEDNDGTKVEIFDILSSDTTTDLKVKRYNEDLQLVSNIETGTWTKVSGSGESEITIDTIDVLDEKYHSITV